MGDRLHSEVGGRRNSHWATAARDRLRELGYVDYRRGYGYFVSPAPPGAG